MFSSDTHATEVDTIAIMGITSDGQVHPTFEVGPSALICKLMARVLIRIGVITQGSECRVISTYCSEVNGSTPKTPTSTLAV